MRTILSLLALTLLLGCSTLPKAADGLSAPEGVITKLTSVAIPDLQAASADAKAHNDPVADQCWSGLIPIVQQIQTLLAPKAPADTSGAACPGLFCRVQKARDAKTAVDALVALRNSGQVATIRQAINLACGALWVDINASIVDPLGLTSGVAP